MNADDRRLIAETLAGHPDSFGHLVRHYQDRLFNSIFRVVDHADDACDVVQEAFIHAYQSLHNFKGDAEFFTWLYRIAFNSAISLRRKRRAIVSLDSGADQRGVPEPIDESDLTRPGQGLERSEAEARLKNALARMSPEHRAVLVLKELDGQKYEEIAAVLDVPVGTVRSRLHRARLELRELLEPTEE